MPVAEMPSVREVHRQNFVPRFNGCEIDSHVRLCAAVRLHVYMLAAEEPLRAINGQLLSNIDILTAAVPALSWITFGIFVRENTALRFHYRTAGEIFGGNQFDVFPLARFLRDDHIENFRIDSAQRLAVPRRRFRSGRSGFDAWRRIIH